MPGVGHRGWLDVDGVDWEIQEIVTDAYRMVAPERSVEQLEAS
jgi:hypothetical protein